jgi:hypothetical protein
LYALHSQMGELDFAVEPEVECPDNDSHDAAFVRATATIGGLDAVKEYVACRTYPLAASFSFESVALGTTPVSKGETALPLFAIGTVAAEHANHVLADVETEAKMVLGSFGSKEYDALVAVNIPNGGQLIQVLEQMGMPYAPHPIPGSDAS